MAAILVGPPSGLAEQVSHVLEDEGFETRRVDPDRAGDAAVWRTPPELVVDLAEPVAPGAVGPVPDRAGTTRRVLAALPEGVERYVLVSSLVVYAPVPSPAAWPVQEHAPRRPHGDTASRDYGASCIAAEDAVVRAAARTGMEFAVVRLAVLDGSPTSAFTAEVRDGVRRRPSAAESQYEALGVMQWLDVRDAATAVVDAALESTAAGQAFNVAGAESFTIHDLTADGSEAPAAEPAAKFDLTKAQVLLGWEPRHPVSDRFPAPGRHDGGPTQRSARHGTRQWPAPGRRDLEVTWA